MKKFFVLTLTLLAGAINMSAQDCVQTSTTLKGTASVSLTRYVHKHLPGAFSVKVSPSTGDTVFVFFSQGNLQFQGSTKTWRFAEHQYDVIGNAAGNTTRESDRENQTNWIDLFGWGCSGYDDGVTAEYQPWSAVDDPSVYFDGGDLNRGNVEHEWALHNAIINGGLDAQGPAAHKWRAMTSDEWDFLFNSRTTNGEHAADLFGMGTLNGVYGIFLLPDNWNWAEVDGGSFESAWTPASSSLNYSANLLTDLDLWTVLENAGVVFLPVTGRRKGVKVNDPTQGFYWSITATSRSGYTKVLNFGDGVAPYILASGYAKKEQAKAVRAVREPSSVDAAE